MTHNIYIYMHIYTHRCIYTGIYIHTYAYVYIYIYIQVTFGQRGFELLGPTYTIVGFLNMM